MSKRILILTGSPRTGGNSDRLAEAFAKGAEAAGNPALEEAYQPRTHQITGIQTCGRRITTLNAQQVSVMKTLLNDLEGHVRQAPPEELAPAQANYMNNLPIKVSYAL